MLLLNLLLLLDLMLLLRRHSIGDSLAKVRRVIDIRRANRIQEGFLMVLLLFGQLTLVISLL